ncbi:MAG: hypothetical protein KA368_08760 [Acidobacteria bacterium]|nr:hypothetical protein [Acidobacteriota bacterium]
MITTTDNQENLMRLYLLGDLPEPEQLTLEAGFFADGNLLLQIQDTETDLVDEYVRGVLPQAERQQFELHYLTTPAHKERVAFAKELLQAANEQALPQPIQPKESFFEKLLAGLFGPQFDVGTALATAVLLLLVGGGWMAIQKTLWQQNRNQERIAELQRIRELENQIAQQTERNAELTAELARLNERMNTKPTPTAAQTVFSFILLSGVRGSEQQTLNLPPGAEHVRLRIKLEADDFPRYRASLRPVDGGPSWTPSVTKTGSTISVKIPAQKLRKGDYILTLTGVNATGSTEEINRYSFRVADK